MSSYAPSSLVVPPKSKPNDVRSILKMSENPFGGGLLVPPQKRPSEVLSSSGMMSLLAPKPFDRNRPKV